MDSSSKPDFDCVIVGAGLAGAAAAAVLGRQNIRTALVDPRITCPPAFKAEKVEPDQAETLRRLGLIEGIVSHAVRIREVSEGFGGHVHNRRRIEQYGIVYQDLVNAVRRQIPAPVVVYAARATHALAGPVMQHVELDNGARLSARLLILAAGTVGKLREELGIGQRMVREAHSLASGFDIARIDAQPFPFQALTYYVDPLRTSIDYLTLFPVPGRMRVNIFSFRDPKDPWVRELAVATRASVDRDAPGLERLTGAWNVSSKVESRPVDLYVADKPLRDGVVLLGDALQSVCPATGTGLSKALMDVETLCLRHLPRWLATPGMQAAKLADYYRDPHKLECDRRSLKMAEYRRQFGTARSLRWKLQRRRAYALITLARIRQRVGWKSEEPLSDLELRRRM